MTISPPPPPRHPVADALLALTTQVGRIADAMTAPLPGETDGRPTTPDDGRRHTADTITDDQLDVLYRERDTARRALDSGDLRLVDEMLSTVSDRDAELASTRRLMGKRIDRLTACAKQAEAELAALHEGEEPYTAEGTAASPAQWIWLWNQATPAERLAKAEQILDMWGRLDRCVMGDHEARLAQRRAAGYAAQTDAIARTEHTQLNRHHMRPTDGEAPGA